MKKEWYIKFLCVLLGVFGCSGLLLLLYLQIIDKVLYSEYNQIIGFIDSYDLFPYVLLFIAALCSSIIISVIQILHHKK